MNKQEIFQGSDIKKIIELFKEKERSRPRRMCFSIL